MSTQATLVDPDVDRIEITITLKDGKKSGDMSPFVMERAILKHMAASFPSWAEYWSKAKTLGPDPPPVYAGALGCNKNGR